MVATPIAATSRYIHPQDTRIYWAESIADVQDPTRGELDAGDDLTGEVADVVGWRPTAQTESIQSIQQLFDARLDTTISVDGSTLVFYADRDGTDVHTLLPRGSVGHIVFLHGGDATGNPMDVWPVRVASLSRPVDVSGSAAATIAVQFVVTADPGLSIPVPS